MLENTFCHIPGIGPKTERRLWEAGLHSWRAVAACEATPFPPAKTAVLKRHVRESITHLEGRNPEYFYESLPADQHWRLFSEFRDSIAYLDIETTGLGGPDDYITTIVLYDGQTIRHYVQGDNLFDFKDDIDQYRILVTYNGKSFDVPFIRNYFRIPVPQAQIDLRYVLASLGYRGGLKGCEKQLGLDRGELEDVDGYFAVLLWFDFLNQNNERALETLLAYNARDVVNLETLAVMAYNLKLKSTPFARDHGLLPLPAPADIPFAPDTETIQRLRRDYRLWES